MRITLFKAVRFYMYPESEPWAAMMAVIIVGSIVSSRRSM